MMKEFDAYIKENWPAAVPKDCTRLKGREEDCIARNLPRYEMCSSCLTFFTLAEAYEKLEKVRT